MRAARHAAVGCGVRHELTREGLDDLMKELARSAPGRRSFKVYFVGGGTAVYAGWRASTIDADLYSDDEQVFHDIQGIKERLNVNIEFARPEDFVPPLSGSDNRHVFIKAVSRVSFFHYDPYAQILSKLVRGFERDVQDARCFISSGMVDTRRLRALVGEIPNEAYAKYPALTKRAVLDAVEDFLSQLG